MKMENKILYFTIPKVTQLKYFMVGINFAQNDCGKFLNTFNRQKIIARRLIEIRNDILAAPVNGKVSHLHVIISNESHELEDLKNAMDELGLEMHGPLSLHHALYLECIRFTLNVKLADEWNQVENYFVKSDKFLKTDEILESVRFPLIITDGYLSICPSSLRLKLPLMNLTDLGIDFESLHKTGSVNIRQRVYTLPDFKPATAVRACLKLPSSCPFKEYSDLRDYWRTIYGYCLPKSTEGMIYIEVSFGWNGFTYVYPIMCVFPYEPLRFRSRTGANTVKEFLGAMERKFTNICGHPLPIRDKSQNLCLPVRKLRAASEADHETTVIYESDPSKLKRESDFYCRTRKNNQDFERESIKSFLNDTKSSLSITTANQNAAPRSMTLSKTLNETFICYETFRPQKNKNLSENATRPFKRIKPDESVVCPSTENNSNFITLQSQNVKSYGEIECLARSKNLKVFSISILKNFCKENNIGVKSKDKKDILIQKIYEFFAIH